MGWCVSRPLPACPTRRPGRGLTADSMSRPDVNAILRAFRADLEAATDPATVDEVRRAHAGKKSPLKEALRGLREVPADERAAVAKAVNDAQEQVEAELAAATERVETLALDARLASEWQD